MDATAHAATRRRIRRCTLILRPPSRRRATLTVTADYRLSEAGRKASLLNGGNGRAEQRLKLAVPRHATASGARRRERHRAAEAASAVQAERRAAHRPDQARARLRSPADARRTLPGCGAQSRTRARVSRAADDEPGRQARDERRVAEQVALAFLGDPSPRAVVYPAPTPRRCQIMTDRGRRALRRAPRHRRCSAGAARSVPAIRRGCAHPARPQARSSAHTTCRPCTRSSR